jgi:superfamily I DNA/RNA helicase
MRVVERIRAAVPVTVRASGGSALGRRTGRARTPVLAAEAVGPGMAMFTEDGDFDVVEKVERVADRARLRPQRRGDAQLRRRAGSSRTTRSTRSAAPTSTTSFVRGALQRRGVVKLEQNYRSTQTVLDAANAVIAHNRDQKMKELWTDHGKGDPITVRELDDEHSEARFVVGEIDRLVDEGGSLAEIAIFYRTNAMSRVLEDTLVRREVGYQVVGGTKFYDRAEIKDAMAYLLWLSNPQDVISFSRIVNSPKRGIGQTSVARVLSHADTMGISPWEAAEAPETCRASGTAAVKAFTRFMTDDDELRERRPTAVPVGDLLEAVLNETGYLDALEAERTIEAEGRLENLQALVEGAREFDAIAEEDEDTSTSSCSRSRCSPTRLAPRRRGRRRRS